MTASHRAARVAEEMRLAREAAEVSSLAKQEFLSSMSHELRNPLNAVLGFAQLLERDRTQPLAARHRERVHQILRSGEHLLCLINDILDLSRVEAGAVSISPEPIGLVELLAEVESTLVPMAAACRVRIEVEARPNEKSVVVADRTRLRQILMNFGSNAIKYNRPAGVVVFSISTPTEALLRLTVRDNGIGIPLAKQSKIFQPFERAGQECGPIEGSGIGLMVTRRLATLMGGSVGFVSRPDEGSEFWVDIPIRGELPSGADERPA